MVGSENMNNHEGAMLCNDNGVEVLYLYVRVRHTALKLS